MAEQGQTEAEAADGAQVDVKRFFENAGVPFPAGTTVTYNKSEGRLVAANTPDNLKSLETVLSSLAVKED